MKHEKSKVKCIPFLRRKILELKISKFSETFFFFFFNQLLNDCKLPAKTILILAIFRML